MPVCQYAYDGQRSKRIGIAARRRVMLTALLHVCFLLCPLHIDCVVDTYVDKRRAPDSRNLSCYNRNCSINRWRDGGGSEAYNGKEEDKGIEGSHDKTATSSCPCSGQSSFFTLFVLARNVRFTVNSVENTHTLWQLMPYTLLGVRLLGDDQQSNHSHKIVVDVLTALPQWARAHSTHRGRLRPFHKYQAMHRQDRWGLWKQLLEQTN